ncbi:MAG: hypothetical protein HZA77_10020 [Candidatus Schekmanbacteria bacterium]|nr:hypothetical protein [Candidatus Schekmanbacteria bacterium]
MSNIKIYLLITAIIFYAFNALGLGLCLQDDAFISLRYAMNFSQGNGLVYNLGEKVEGYTNFSWTIISSIPFFLNIDGVTFLRYLGLLSGCLAILAVFILTRIFVSKDSISPGISSLILASIPYFRAESIMGLETVFYGAMIILSVSAYIYEERNYSRICLSGLLLTFTVLTRPDGLIVAGIIGLIDLSSILKKKTFNKKLILRWSFFIPPVVTHFIFRFFYYGDIVPNTFHTKVGNSLSVLFRGINYGVVYFHKNLILIIISIIGATILLMSRKLPTKEKTTLFLIPAIYILYVCFIGGDFKPTFRFYIVITLYLAFLSSVAIEKTSQQFLLMTKKPALFMCLMVGITGLFSMPLNANDYALRRFTSERKQSIQFVQDAAFYLKAIYPPQTIIATGNAGGIPFFTEFTSIDMYGLCDRHIAMRIIPEMGRGFPGHEKGDGVYVLDRNPDLIFFQEIQFTKQKISMDEIKKMHLSLSETEIWENRLFHSNYKLENIRLKNYYFNFFKKKISPIVLAEINL